MPVPANQGPVLSSDFAGRLMKTGLRVIKYGERAKLWRAEFMSGWLGAALRDPGGPIMGLPLGELSLKQAGRRAQHVADHIQRLRSQNRLTTRAREEDGNNNDAIAICTRDYYLAYSCPGFPQLWSEALLAVVAIRLEQLDLNLIDASPHPLQDNPYIEQLLVAAPWFE